MGSLNRACIEKFEEGSLHLFLMNSSTLLSEAIGDEYGCPYLASSFFGDDNSGCFLMNFLLKRTGCVIFSR